MQSNGNKIIIASAGSGKTTFLVDEALSQPAKKIAILTYTHNNISEIRNKFYKKHGGIAKGVDVLTWFSFLLRECARPYQRAVYPKQRIKTVYFTKGRSPYWESYSDTDRYYFRKGNEIYSDKISRFVIDCDVKSNGLVTKRLRDIYHDIFIDEFQDLGGWDLALLELFLESGIRLLIVGDPRQCTYTTNNAAKYSQFRGVRVLDLIREWEGKNLCQIENHARSYRCNQTICGFADNLWPDMAPAVSYNTMSTGHDGIFVVSKNCAKEYIERFSPALLRYDKKTKIAYGRPALNFGSAKGLEFERVLIVPHGPIRKYLESGDVNDVKGSVEKFYVAVTRAKHSVALVYDGECRVECREWPVGGEG